MGKLKDLLFGKKEKQIFPSPNAEKLEQRSKEYYEMALSLRDQRKDFFGFLKQSAEMKLKALREEGWEKTEILAGCCPECDKLEGKIFTIEDALEKMPIPNKNCSNKSEDEMIGFCICMYESAGELSYDKFK